MIIFKFISVGLKVRVFKFLFFKCQKNKIKDIVIYFFFLRSIQGVNLNPLVFAPLYFDSRNYQMIKTSFNIMFLLMNLFYLLIN